MSGSSPSPRVVRPRWSSVGGGSILIAAILLLIATLLEYGVRQAGSVHTPLFWTFFVVFALCSLLFGFAMVPLAFGSTGSNGIVGTSVLGKVGLLGFGLFWIVSQVVYVSGYFAAQSDAVQTLSLILTALMFVSAIIAAIVIVIRKVATGLARWSLVIALVISAVTSAISQSSDSLVLLTVMEVISTLGQIYVGITYLLAKTAPIES